MVVASGGAYLGDATGPCRGPAKCPGLRTAGLMADWPAADWWARQDMSFWERLALLGVIDRIAMSKFAMKRAENP